MMKKILKKSLILLIISIGLFITIEYISHLVGRTVGVVIFILGLEFLINFKIKGE